MKVPFGGNVNARLVEKRFEGQIFYYVFDQQSGKGYKIGYGFLKISGSIDHPRIRYFDLNHNLSRVEQGCSWGMIFKTLDEAKVKLKEMDELYCSGFAIRPFINKDLLTEIKPQLIEVELVLNLIFKGDKDFDGVSFCDVGAYGIQVYAGGYRSTINYDLSNKVSVIGSFIKAKHGK